MYTLEKKSPQIHTLSPLKLIGISMKMSVQHNRTGDLWRQFMPRLSEIPFRANGDKISLQHYPTGYFSAFQPEREFEKWATVAVSKWGEIPSGMQQLEIPGGLYAKWDYRGPAGNPAIFQWIFGEWLPGSGFEVDERPHFEVLGDKYSNTREDSEEEIWVPVKSS